MRPLTLTLAEFASLASGHGSEQAIATLVAGQVAKRRLLLWGVIRDARTAAVPVDGPVALLLRVHTRSPGTLDDVLTHPQVDAWATDFPHTWDVGYLQALAATAGVRARVTFALDVTPVADAVTLPGLGLLAAADRPVRLAFDGDTLTMDGRPAVIRPHRTIDLRDSGGPVVAIDDVDQYRAQYRMPVTAQFADADRFAARWRAAWHLLVAEHPEHARATRMMLRSFVPLERADDRTEHSASSSRASGTIAMAMPHSAASMALLVLHETQHLKLGALLDLIDLDSGDGQRRYHAPWRGDPRPIRGLLQGTYAHLGVTEFWRRRDPRQFAYWRRQTMRATATLAGSGELTPAGTRFVAGMRATLDQWSTEFVPAGDLRIAEVCLRVNEAVWGLTNRTTPADLLTPLITAWRAGSAPPPGLEGVARPASPVEARIVWAIRPETPALPAGDRALLAGHEPTAAEHYAKQILTGDGSDDDWAGLLVALGGTTRPEVARDVYRRLAAEGEPPDPRDLARWCVDAG